MLKMIKSFLGLLLVQLTLLGTPQGLQAQLDPKIEWKQIETKSAYWLFDAKHQEAVEFYIMQFERAKAEVLPLFKEESRKLTIVLLDNTDLANGSAVVSPHPVISLFAVQPDLYSSIGEFKDFVHELLVHEYTHILNMEPVHGWMSPLYWIFGSVAHPNMILPRWYTEGLAVYTESAISKNGGRLNSQYLQGLARALTLEKKWHEYPLSDLNDSHPDWIGGARAYLFGGILWESLAREYGDDVVYKFNQSYSRRIPYLLDGVSEAHTGLGYSEQLSKAYQFWELQAQRQIATITAAPQMDGELITTKRDGQILHPRISPDGLWMAYIKNSMAGVGDIMLTLRHPKRGFRAFEPKKVLSGTRSNHLDWHPSGSGFVYEKLERWKLYNMYYDLYFYDLRTQKSRRITRGQRAHSACFSSDGKTLYFVSNGTARKKIVAMDWASQQVTPLYEGAIGDNIRDLSCGDKNSLYFVEQIQGRTGVIARITPPEKQKTVVFQKLPVHSARLTHRGMLIASPESGVDNLYLLTKGRPARAITNSVTRVLQGELDPLDDGLYFNQLTSDGPQLFYLKGAQWESLPDQPPRVKSITNFEAQTQQAPAQQASAQQTGAQLQQDRSSFIAEDFSPWRYLYPNHWIPFLYVVDGGTLYQAMTSAGDPLGINNLSLIGQWDTLTRKPGATLSYVNNSTPVSLGVGLSDFYNFFYASRTTLHFSNASALASFRVSALDQTRFLLKWNYSQLAIGGINFIRQGPQAEVSYSDTDRKPQDVFTSEGWRFELGHKNYLADFGNESYGETYAHLGSFWSSFTPKRHAFYLGINASYAPQLTQGFFATSTLAGPFLNPQITNTAFLQRGYPTGIFVAKNILNTNAEYHFPLASFFKGWTSPPLFVRNLQGSVVFDASTLDGRYNNSTLQSSQFTDFGRWFTGYGVELETNVQAGFHVPITFTLGLYYGQDQEAFGGFTTFFNVRL